MIIRSCVTEKNLNWMCGKFRFQNDEISGKITNKKENVLSDLDKAITCKLQLK